MRKSKHLPANVDLPDTSTIPIGGTYGKVKYHLINKLVIPTGINSWVNVMGIFRQEKVSTGTIYKPRITLRKYQLVVDPKKGYKKWLKRQTFNINSAREAAAVLQLIRAIHPDVEKYLEPELENTNG